MLTMLRTARARYRTCRALDTPTSADDGGFTLVEMLIATGLSTLLGAMALTWFLGASSSATTSTNTDIANANARNAVQSWAQLLTVAHSPVNDPAGAQTPQLVSITPTSITFNADVGALPACSTSACTTTATTPITLSTRANGTNGYQLIQQIGSSAAATTVVPAGVTQPTNSTCLFTAYTTVVTATGTPIVMNLGCGSATAPLTASSLATVNRVDLSFTVTTGGHSRTYQTSAALTGAQPSGGHQ